jgi:hypothetical protein
VLALSACRVVFPEDLPYACASDSDCGGSPFICIDVPTKHCCSPAEPREEICGNQIDDDCDGNVDGAGRVEVCNGLDDDCDNSTDEGFNLSSDPTNCGTCGTRCTSRQMCVNGKCLSPIEDNCLDAVDNDMDGDLDCVDSDCTGQTCGMGCKCKNGAKGEAKCNDGLDGDGDGMTDCADSDCAGESCGTGCTCGGGAKTETNCFDNLDNDGDGMTDCDDADCLNKFCTSSPVFFTCTASQQCKCNGGTQQAEVGAACGDGLDNDCNGATDCAEAACNSLPCQFGDGGTGTCTTLMCQ